MNTTISYFIKSFMVLIFIYVTGCQRQKQVKDYETGEVIRIPKAILQDKIKGGWAGQVIGCTYGGPTEFQWNGTIIDDHIPIPWDETRMHWYYQNVPGLYDDVYMDLTFVDVFEKYGFDAPDSLHALAFAHAQYPLWHANQAARYNILNGMMPPESGFWKNNPHADDIDFQIEADFAGLMAPGMINTAVEISNRIGHIMNYGDGVYGGIYVASMYALAFVHDNIEFVVEEALKSIPAESDFHKCIADVIAWYKKNPNDWKYAWFEAQKKWTHDEGCPDGVFKPFNIDAKINAAYIVTGLLYGKGDFGATIDISTRCGYDSDCNPANAAGILGTMIGYDSIPDYWKQGIDKVEDLNFQYTSMSLNKVYETGYRHAVEMIKMNSGKEDKEDLLISYQKPQSVMLEKSFDDIFPTERRRIGVTLSNNNPIVEIEFDGCGFVIGGRAVKDTGLPELVAEVDVFVGDQLIETSKLPTQWVVRRHEIAWNYDLAEKPQVVTLKLKDIQDGYTIEVGDLLVYSKNEPEPKIYYSSSEEN